MAGILIQKGSYNPAEGMRSYLPDRYSVPNLKIQHTDKYKLRVKTSYEKAAIVNKPEVLMAVFKAMMSDPSKGLTNADIDRATSDKEKGAYANFLKHIAASSLTANEKCILSGVLTDRYDLVSLVKYVQAIEDVLSKRGATLKDISLVIEEPFYGVDYRLTTYGQENADKGFMADNYPNHHTITRVTVVPRIRHIDPKAKIDPTDNVFVMEYFGVGVDDHGKKIGKWLIDHDDVLPGNGKPGVMVNTDFTEYDKNVRKKKTVKNIPNEFSVLEEIRKLGGGKEKIADGDYAGKSAELLRLVSKLEIKDLATNDTVTGFKGWDDGLLSDLTVVHAVLSNVYRRGWQDKVNVDFFEPLLGIKGRHLIDSALIYDKRGFKGVKERCIPALNPVGTCK